MSGINGAYRYEELRVDTKDNKWLSYEWSTPDNVSAEGQQGIMKAFNTFSKAFEIFALHLVAGTPSGTVGQMISSPVVEGQLPDIKQSNLYINLYLRTLCKVWWYAPTC